MAKRKEWEDAANWILTKARNSTIGDIESEIQYEIERMYESVELADYFTSNIINKGGWQVYNSSDFNIPLIVLNVKGEGFPDWDKVISMAAKKSNIAEDRIKAYCDDSFLDHLFWAEVNFKDDDLLRDIKARYGMKYVRAGRSGGYIGVEFDDNFIKINYDKLEKVILDLVKKEDLVNYILDGKEFEFFLTREDEKDYNPINPDDIDLKLVQASSYLQQSLENSFYEVVREKFDEVFNQKFIEDNNLIISDENIGNNFKNLEKDLKATIAYFAKPDRWVDLIITNEYWESNKKQAEFERPTVIERIIREQENAKTN